MNYGYIYETTNKKNGMFYIGKSKGFFNPNYHGSGIFLNHAINKYGKNNFHTRLIIYVRTKKQLNEIEKMCILIYRSAYGKKRLYNVSDGGDGGPLFQGHKHSDKTKKQMELIHLGKSSGMKGKHLSKETKEKIRKNHSSNSTFKDKHHSEETKLKIKRTKLGIKRKPFTKECIKNMVKNHKGMLGKIPWNKDISKEKIELFIKENTNKNLCKCGCKQFIVIKKRHYYTGIPLLKQWHQLKKGVKK